MFFVKTDYFYGGPSHPIDNTSDVKITDQAGLDKLKAHFDAAIASKPAHHNSAGHDHFIYIHAIVIDEKGVVGTPMVIDLKLTEHEFSRGISPITISAQ